MKAFACGAVVPGCDATFRAPTEEELLAEVAAHAERDHGLRELPEGLVSQARAQIRDVE